MQNMHSKLNDMNEVGEQIGTQLNNSPQLSNSINTKMDVLESKWNALLEQMEFLSKACTELQQIEIIKAKIAASSVPSVTTARPEQQQQQPAHAASADAVSGGGGDVSNTVTTTTTSSQQADAVSDDGGESIKKRRMQITDEDRRNFESTVNQLNKALDNVKAILTTDNPNKDEQFDFIRVSVSSVFFFNFYFGIILSRLS